MKIGIVGDLHCGFSTTKSQITHAINKGQYQAIEAMVLDFEGRGLTDLVFVGDIFDNRRFVASDILDWVYRFFDERLAKFQCHIIAGNHDMLYDNSSEVCLLRMLSRLPNVHLYMDKVGMEHIGNKKWFFVPWVQEDKMESVSSWLLKVARGNIDNNVIVGHFDMIGAQMEAKTVSKAGFEPQMFLNAARLTISGHYHCRSEIDDGESRILYTGTPYHMSFGHVGVAAGYHVYDDETGEIEFIENTVSPIFIETSDTALDQLPDDLSRCIVKYNFDRTMEYDKAAMLKSKLVEKHPIYVDSVPYGDLPVTDTQSTESTVDEDEARRIMSLDSVGMASLYLDKHPEILPDLDDGDDAKEMVLSYIREYNSKIK